MLLILSVLFCSILCIRTENINELPKITQRIINGEETQITNFPYHVRLNEKNGGFICGGTIVGDRAILTAAHCTVGKNISIQLGIGVSKRSSDPAAIKNVTPHPEYDSSMLKHDLAVIILKENITYGPKVCKIEMAQANGNFPQKATVVGWGCTACIWFIPMWFCNIFPTSKYLKFGELTLERHFGQQFESNSLVKICPGDSGGPVINKDGKLIGVISHMDVSFDKNRPNYFMSVPDHIEWIRETIKQKM